MDERDERDGVDIEIEIVDDDVPEAAARGGAPDMSVDDTAVQAELGKLQDEVDRLKEMYLRKLADFDNYRKRQDREMSEFRRTAQSGLIRDLLPVIDNLERALEVPASGGDALRTGVELVVRQALDLLGRHGVAVIDPVGAPFDPTLHEAFQRTESSEVVENTVVQVFQKGYTLHDKLLRPALVVVAVPPSTAPAPDDRPVEG